jgi:glutathione synthase/RimK-type ligase-like ATP-grasp enzyme
METLRENLLGEDLARLKSYCFGTLEELQDALRENAVPFPCVIKPSSGAMSRGVACAKSAEELCHHARIISRTPHYVHEFKEYARSKRSRYYGYVPESRYQGKFIVQPLVDGLDGDWKVLVYGNQYYVLKRHVRPGDFRASGSHVNYLPGRHSGIPDVVLDYVHSIYQKLNIPHLSVDVAYDGSRPYLIEFQAVHFGTSTQAEFCEEYFIKQDGEWGYLKKTMNQEEVYAWGVAYYLRRHLEIARA